MKALPLIGVLRPLVAVPLLLPFLLQILVSHITATDTGSMNNDAAASSAALNQILHNTKIIQCGAATRTTPDENETFRFVLPCQYYRDNTTAVRDSRNGRDTIWVQESTASLLAAKALAKTVLQRHRQEQQQGATNANGNPLSSTREQASKNANGSVENQRLDPLAWDVLDSLLRLPIDENDQREMMPFQAFGLLPKYWYASPNSSHDRHHHPSYIQGTRFPHWSLFATQTDRSNHRRSSTLGNSSSLYELQSSHRLSAIPLHASIVWDMVLSVIPSQDSDANNNNNNRNYSTIIKQQQQSDRAVTTTGTEAEPHYAYNYDNNKEWWDKLNDFFHRIYRHHAYIHTVVMRGCFTEYTNTLDGNSTIPCYNILHPWESFMDPTALFWKTALQSTVKVIQERNWLLPFKIPKQVRNAYDFPNDEQVYKAMMYLLLEGWNKVDLEELCPQNTTDFPHICAEDALWHGSSSNSSSIVSQFAMLDVGYAAILAQADADLYQLARVLQLVLPDNYYYDSRRKKQFQQQLQSLEQWQYDNAKLFQTILWNETHQTYLSRYYYHYSDENNNASSSMEWLDYALSNNLLSLWNVATIENDPADFPSNKEKRNSDDLAATLAETSEQQLKDISLQLLRRDGDGNDGNSKQRFSFDCGDYPLWSRGGCYDYDKHNATSNPPIIQPIINYLVANGLERNDDLEILGRYMSETSLELFSRHLRNDTSMYVFGEAFGVDSPFSNLANDAICGNTSTLTAAIVYNLMVPDPVHEHRIPLPPIRRSWVITLITVELFVAFSIGVSCLVLSFNLVRTLRHTTIEPGLEPPEGALYDYDDSENNTYYDATSVITNNDQQNNNEVWDDEDQPFLRR